MKRLLLLLALVGIAAAQAPGHYGHWLTGLDSAARSAEQMYREGKPTGYEIILGVYDCKGNQLNNSRHKSMDKAKEKAKEHGVMGCRGTLAKKPLGEGGFHGFGEWLVADE